MKLTQLTAVAVCAMALSACNCGNTHLVQVPEEPLVGLCGNGRLEAPEECDFGFDGNRGGVGSCAVDCRLVRSCEGDERWDEERTQCAPVEPVVDSGVAGDATVEGVAWHHAGILAPTALHPHRPIEAVTVHLHRLGGGPPLASVTTLADGRYHFEVRAGVSYELRYDFPARYYSEPDYRREVSALQPGELAQVDYFVVLKGLSWVARDSSSAALGGVEVRVVDAADRVLSGPVLTDADGYVHLQSANQQGRLVFEKAGYRRYEVGMPAVDTTHTVMGGCVLQRP